MNKWVRPSFRVRLALWLYQRQRERLAAAREFPWVHDRGPWWERALGRWSK